MYLVGGEESICLASALQTQLPDGEQRQSGNHLQWMAVFLQQLQRWSAVEIGQIIVLLSHWP